MDFMTFGSIMTVLACATFVGIVLWAYSHTAKRNFDEAARLPFEEDGEENGESSR